MAHEDPIGLIVRNMVDVRRLSNGLARDARDEVRAIINDIVAELARIDPTAVERDRYRQGRVDKLLQRLRERVGPQYTELRRMLESQAARIGAQQATWAADMLGRVIGSVEVNEADGVGVQFFRSILRSRPFQGDTLQKWVDRAQQSTIDNVRQQIQIGMTNAETLDEIVRRIRGRSVGGGRYRGGVLRTSTHHAESIARTAVNFVSNEAHLETYGANTDVLTGVQFTATLDSRTTPICARWDGTVWDVEDPKKQVPPLHYNCRSVLTPVVDWRELGIEPPEDGTRASAEGQVSTAVTYSDWFRRQSKSVQDDIIGPARAELFRRGKLSFRDMVGRDNRILTLEELGA